MTARRWMQLTVIGWGALLALGVAVRAQDKEDPVDPRILAYDKGPSAIDISKYPANIQGDYKVFSTKCKKCHTLARPINCELALDTEWEAYLKRMMRKAGDFITPDDGKKIYEFLSYDTRIRKKALFDKKTKDSAGSAQF